MVPTHAATSTPLVTHQPSGIVQMDLVEAAVRTGRRREAAAHVAAIREAGIAALGSASRCSQARPLRSPPSDESDAGLFEEALVVLGVDRWPFDYARVQLLYGESACGGPAR